MDEPKLEVASEITAMIWERANKASEMAMADIMNGDHEAVIVWHLRAFEAASIAREIQKMFL